VKIMPALESDKKSPGDQVEPGTKQAAENTCRKCNGTGRIDGKPCPDCAGTGKVTEIVGDA
jgi:DnaJ-class molecular chaperone